MGVDGGWGEGGGWVLAYGVRAKECGSVEKLISTV